MGKPLRGVLERLGPWCIVSAGAAPADGAKGVLMETVVCPVCGADVDLEPGTKENDEIVCPVCGAVLRVFKADGAWQAEEVG